MRHKIWLLLLTLLSPSVTIAGLDALDADGWYTWRFDAAEGAPAWCCFSGDFDEPASHACNLDGRHQGYTSCDEPLPADGQVQLYARIKSGEPVRLRMLSPHCVAESSAGISDLGTVDSGASFEWLRQWVDTGSGRRSRLSEDALAAIGMHRGEAPFRYLVDLAEGGANDEVRKQAIFWLGQVRIAEAGPLIERLMGAEDSADIREHAGFVLSQSTYPGRIEALIRQGRGDRDADVRSQAWFWLAQTGASQSEQAIMRVMVDEPDPAVREDSVFALSQLPDDRAVDALLEILENTAYDLELRKASLFWLAQSESDRALDSVERLLLSGRADQPLLAPEQN
jgi:HEAT repeat protein